MLSETGVPRGGFGTTPKTSHKNKEGGDIAKGGVGVGGYKNNITVLHHLSTTCGAYKSLIMLVFIVLNSKVLK